MSRPQKVLTAKHPDREIFDRQIPDCQISDRQISDRQIPDRQIFDRPLSPTGGVNPTRVSPLSWDRRLSCYQIFYPLNLSLEIIETTIQLLKLTLALVSNNISKEYLSYSNIEKFSNNS